jgi:hypothetical protein
MKRSFQCKSINGSKKTFTTIIKEGSMKNLISMMVAVLCLGFTAPVFAAQYSFSYTGNYITQSGGGLDHTYYYAWNLPLALSQGQTITSAVISISALKNYANEQNDLFVNFLKDTGSAPTSFIVAGTDNNNNSNDLNSLTGNPYHGTISVTDFRLPWTGLDDKGKANDASMARDVSFTVSDHAVLDFLNSAVSNGSFAVGFDPDCHFYGTEIKLVLDTQPVPEPSSMVLFGIGVAGLCLIRMRKARA